MSKSYPLLSVFIVMLFLFVSCSSDDDGGSTNPQTQVNYFPLEIENAWNFENTFTGDNQPDIVNQESLTLSGTNQVDGRTVYEFTSSNPLNSGPTTLAFSNGFVYKEDSSLFYTGSFGLGIPNFTDFMLEIEDGKVYDQTKNEGTELFSFSDSRVEQLEGISTTIDYTVSSVMGASMESMVVKGEIFNDVISAQLIVSAEISANLGIPVTILEEQDVVIVTNYFAKDVGLIYSETDTTLDFISFPGIPLEDLSFLTIQELTDYSLTSE